MPGTRPPMSLLSRAQRKVATSYERRRGIKVRVVMRRLLLAVLAAAILVVSIHPIALADYSYTLRQKVVIGYIYQACARRDLTDEQCALPLQVAWRETRYGLNIYSQVDTYNGWSTSVGAFQWYAGPRGNCIAGGLGCYGPYYRSYGLGWRENLWMDTDQGVELLTAHMRGYGDWRGHWRAYGVVAPGWPGMPPHFERGE